MRALKLCLVSAVIGLSLLPAGKGGSTASAAEVRVVVDPPVFVPRDDFRYEEGGYYRTHDGHYYHYDHQRAGWHYGRNHEEGVRYERAHERR